MTETARDHAAPLLVANKTAVCRFIEEVCNAGRLELVDELVGADFVGWGPDERKPVLGPDGVRAVVARERGALPGLYVKVADIIAEEDRVVVRWEATATGATPCAGISIVRLLAGRVVDARTHHERPQSSLRQRA